MPSETSITGLYKKKAQMGGNAGGVIVTLVVGVGIAVLMLVLVNTMGATTYQIVQSDIDSIGVVYNSTGGINYSASNFTIQESIEKSITEGFNASSAVGKYIPLIVLGIVVAIILGLIIGTAGMATKGGGGNMSL